MATLIDKRAGPPGDRGRHPEKRERPDTPTLRKPDWIRVRAPTGAEYQRTREIVRENRLVTVCEEAACPNIGECWQQRHATFMILGEVCTRACGFCNVATGLPGPLDPEEPENVARAVAAMGLAHVVVTSVDRDDLEDGGADHFVRTIAAIRTATPATTIEVLTPDFLRKPGAAERVIDAAPDVFNHNLETVPRLYLTIRPGARYYHSLRLLERVKERNDRLFTKSGLMVGLGEERAEVLDVLAALRSAGVESVTVGQYLRPTRHHLPVERYWEPAEFDALAADARALGFLDVASGPLVRSSYNAEEPLARALAARAAGSPPARPEPVPPRPA